MIAPTLVKTQSVDWRLPENRIEAFSRVIHVRMVEGDCDHHHVGRVITEEMGMDNEQKALFCVMFGQSYRNHWAMLAMQTGLYDMSEGDLTDWHNEHWRRMKFGNDTKWGVRRFPPFLKSLKEVVGGGSIYQYFYDAAHVGNTRENYYSLNNALRSIWGMGRMTAWLAQQTFYELFRWDIDHWDQQLWDNGTWSQYDSICYLFNRMDIIRKKLGPDGKVIKYDPSRDNISEMEEATQVLMTEVNKRIPFHVDIFNVESVECEYRKTAHGPKIKEYTFWTTNELVELFFDLKEAWGDYDGPGEVDWRPYVTGFMTKGPNLRDYGYDKSYFRVVYEKGLNLNTHTLYTDEPDAHQLLDLPVKTPLGFTEMQRIWDNVEDKARKMEDYNPVNFLQFKPKDHPAWGDPNVDFSYVPSSLL